METPFDKSFSFNFSKISENFAGINFRDRPENYDFAGINIHEWPKNSWNCESFYPRNFLPLKYLLNSMHSMHIVWTNPSTVIYSLSSSCKSLHDNDMEYKKSKYLDTKLYWVDQKLFVKHCNYLRNTVITFQRNVLIINTSNRVCKRNVSCCVHSYLCSYVVFVARSYIDRSILRIERSCSSLIDELDSFYTKLTIW